MSLREEYELIFTSGTTARLYVDPAELQILFPDAPYVEIFELVRMFSLEMKEAFNYTATSEIPLDVQEYIKAATACALTRLYDIGGTGGPGDLTFRLGDLSVESPSQVRNEVTRANASNWCELAAVLREELLRTSSGAGMRAIVKGSNYPNPMPCRVIRHKDNAPMSVWE
jgi:hypothetical protein